MQNMQMFVIFHTVMCEGARSDVWPTTQNVLQNRCLSRQESVCVVYVCIWAAIAEFESIRKCRISHTQADIDQGPMLSWKDPYYHELGCTYYPELGWICYPELYYTCYLQLGYKCANYTWSEVNWGAWKGHACAIECHEFASRECLYSGHGMDACMSDNPIDTQSGTNKRGVNVWPWCRQVMVMVVVGFSKTDLARNLQNGRNHAGVVIQKVSNHFCNLRMYIVSKCALARCTGVPLILASTVFPFVICIVKIWKWRAACGQAPTHSY